MKQKRLAFKLWTLTLVAIFAGTPSASAVPAIQSRPPPGNGASFLIGGIVLASVFGGLGALTVMYQGSSSTSGDGKGDVIGVGLIALGAGLGIPLMINGMTRLEKSKKWRREQKARQKAEEEADEEDFSLGEPVVGDWTLSLTSIDSKPAASLTYIF